MTNSTHKAARAIFDAVYRPGLALAITAVVLGLVRAVVFFADPTDSTPLGAGWIGPVAIACALVSAIPIIVVLVLLWLSKRGER